MEDRSILVDTSIIIELLRKKNKQNTYLWRLKELNFNCFVSAITVFELYAGAITKKHKEDLRKLLKWMEIIPFTNEIAQLAADIYKDLKLNNQLIEFRDIFIGATALEGRLPMATLNKEHFERIKGIDIYCSDNNI